MSREVSPPSCVANTNTLDNIQEAMADSIFWRNLAEDFRRLPSRGVYISWQFTSGRPGRYEYRIFATESLRVTFKQLAQEAGIALFDESDGALDESRGKRSLDVWLDELRKHEPPRNQGERAGPLLDDGNEGFYLLGGKNSEPDRKS